MAWGEPDQKKVQEFNKGYYEPAGERLKRGYRNIKSLLGMASEGEDSPGEGLLGKKPKKADPGRGYE